MTPSSSSLDALRRARPEWLPWLSVLEEVVRHDNSAEWEYAVPWEVAHRDARVPLLDGVSIALHANRVRGLLERLIRLATLSDTDAMRSLKKLRPTDSECVEFFARSVRQDVDKAREHALTHGADPEAMQALVALLPIPFLLACNGRLAKAVSPAWTQGYCPTCGSWPAFVEIRGIERRRYFRCSRCGGEWYARALVCPFCETNDHDQLATLVPAKSDGHAAIDACNSCHGYMKAFTRLQGCTPAAVMVDDVATVELDMAALDQGYARRTGAGYPVEVSVTEISRGLGIFRWGS